jgi:hypothetical protein
MILKTGIAGKGEVRARITRLWTKVVRLSSRIVNCSVGVEAQPEFHAL